MAKQKTGLHKEISTIFDGVPLPAKKTGQNQSGAAPVERTAAPKPATGIGTANTAASSTASVSAQPPKPSVPTVLQKSVQEAAVPKPRIITAPEIRFQNPSIIDKLRPFLDNIKAKVLTPQPGVSQSRQLATVVMVPALFIVVIFIFGRQFLKSSQSNTVQEVTQLANVATNYKTEIDWKIPEPYPGNLRDPMVRISVGAANAVAEQFIVRGIVYSDDNPSAIIGTSIVYQGDTFGGAKIVKITRDSVEFEQDGKTWTQKVQR